MDQSIEPLELLAREIGASGYHKWAMRLRALAGQQTSSHRVVIQVAAPQPEAPTLAPDELLRRLESSEGSSILRAAAERIRTLQARAEELWRLYAASREREAQAYERAAKVCDSVNNYDNPMTARDCAAAIRALATPDSAASPTGGEG